MYILRVSVGDEAITRRVRIGRVGDAQTGRHHQRRGPDPDTVFEDDVDARREGEGFIDVGDIRTDDEELVTADSTDEVTVAHRVAQQPGDSAQERIADGMAEIIVDRLEIVEVDEDDRDTTADVRGEPVE